MNRPTMNQPAVHNLTLHGRAMKAFLCALLLGALLGTSSLGARASSSAEAGPVAAAQSGTVNINTADAATLARMLTGIGQSRAEEIVRYRETYGAFATIDELAEVKGIGAATVERNRSLIVLE